MEKSAKNAVVTTVPATQWIPQTRTKNDLRCSYCNLPKTFVDSKFHLGYPAGERRFFSYRVDILQVAFPGKCNFCKLVRDVATLWSVDGFVQSVTTHITYSDSGCDLNITTDLVGYKWFSIFAEEGCGSEWFLRRLHHPSGDTSSTQAVTTIRSWLDTCMNKHKACQGQDQSRSMPARLLRLDRDYVQLCENIDQPQPYACLSHCWGATGPKLKLAANNIASMRVGLPVTRLPKTFKDAVEVSLNIGIQYLWIDALCVLQDDLKDWHATAASMADIYAGAVLTLAASWANDSECGLFSRMRDTHKAFPLQEPGLFARYPLPIFPTNARTPSSDGSDLWPLLRRAWVFQERRLSSRVLHFGAEQLYWECCSAAFTEDGVDDNKEMSSSHFKSISNDTITAWREAVQHYSGLKLTYESDRLPAISAVVKRMQVTRKDDVYVAGMWRNSLLEDLSWQTTSAPGSRAWGNLPTWSWVSVLREVEWPTYKALNSAALVKLDFEIIGPSHFGRAVKPSVTVKGPTCSLKANWATSPDLTYFRCKVQEPACGIERLCHIHPDFDWRAADSGIKRSDVLTSVFLWYDTAKHSCTVEGLLLKAIGNGQFQRVGYVLLNNNTKKDYLSREFIGQDVSSLPIKEFTIV